MVIPRAPTEDGAAHSPDAVRVGDHPRALQHPRIFPPGRASHLPVTVQRKPAGENRAFGVLAPRENRRHARARRTNAHLQLSFPLYDGAVTDLDAFDIG